VQNSVEPFDIGPKLVSDVG